MTPALTTRKAFLTAVRARMTGVKPRAAQAAVTLRFDRDALGIDAVTIPAEVPAALTGHTVTLNGFLLLELLRRMTRCDVLTLTVTAADELQLTAGTFRVDLIPQALTRPVTAPQPDATRIRQPRRTRRYNGPTQAAAFSHPAGA